MSPIFTGTIIGGIARIFIVIFMFSITRPSGEKFYFNSQKMGLWKNNSEETLKCLEAIRAKKNS